MAATSAQALAPSANRFGVFISGQDVARQDTVSIAEDLGAGWVRLNWNLGGASQDYTLFLKNNINVVLTISNHDPSNIVTTYGTPRNWPNAGFPFKSKAAYEQKVRAIVKTALPYLKQGRRLLVQAENEVSDASINPRSTYWRGTDDQYLAQLQAFYEAVKSVDAGIPVVLSSFASETLDALRQKDNVCHEFAVKHVTTLLTRGKFDVVDLHFYGCVDDIPGKIQAAKALLPAGRAFVWVSTEDGGPDSRCPSTPVSWKQNPVQFEQLEAAQVPARLSACATNGATVCLWFSLFDLKKSGDVFGHLGLLDQDTSPPRRKPAYEAFKVFVSEQTH